MLTGSAPVLSTVSSCLASSSGRPLGSPSLEIEMFWPSGSCTVGALWMSWSSAMASRAGSPLAAASASMFWVSSPICLPPSAVSSRLTMRLPLVWSNSTLAPFCWSESPVMSGVLVDYVAIDVGATALYRGGLLEEDLRLPLLVGVVFFEGLRNVLLGGVDLIVRDVRLRVGSQDLVEAQLGRAPDDADHFLRVLDTGDLDHDLVLRLHPHVGFGDTETVYALPDQVRRLLHLLARYLAPTGLGTLQLRADATLQVEA